MTGNQKASLVIQILVAVLLMLIAAFGAQAWKSMERMEQGFGKQLDAVVAVSQANHTRLVRIEDRISENGLYERMFAQHAKQIQEVERRLLELERAR